MAHDELRVIGTPERDAALETLLFDFMGTCTVAHDDKLAKELMYLIVADMVAYVDSI